MLEVVACNNKLLAELAMQCRQVGLNTKVIDIQETALRNLATLLPENLQGIALLHLQNEGGKVIIQKQGELFLSRKIGNGYLQLAADVSEDSDPLMQEQLHIEQDNLALEIQRSFDFVENYFDIPPITSLATVLMPDNTQSIINALNKNHGITARAMDLSAIVDTESLLSDMTQNLCAPVIGASLRRSVESLQS
jgi:MSHA biogenesis protein MshI